LGHSRLLRIGGRSRLPTATSRLGQSPLCRANCCLSYDLFLSKLSQIPSWQNTNSLLWKFHFTSKTCWVRLAALVDCRKLFHFLTGLLLLRGHQTSLRGLVDVGIHTAYGTTKLPQELRTLASIWRLSGSKKQRTNIAQGTESGLTNVSLRHPKARVDVPGVSILAAACEEVTNASGKAAKATKNTINHY
jgi:hypothetical protein